MVTQKKKMSTAKIFALVISIGLHAALIYYLGGLALDYALPEGEVTSYEMDWSQGNQLDSTEIDVIKAEPTQKSKTAKQPVEPKPKSIGTVESKPKQTPEPLPTEEVVDKDGTMPVSASNIPEDTHKEFMEDKSEEPQELPHTLPEKIPTTADSTSDVQPPHPEPSYVPDTGPTNGGQTDQAFGTPTGVQSDTVLIPYGSNRPISYPRMARFRKYEGVAIIHYAVTANGQVTNVMVMKSSGYSILDSEAVNTIKNWKFKPTGRDGIYERPVRFRLTGDAEIAPAQLRRQRK